MLLSFIWWQRGIYGSMSVSCPDAVGMGTPYMGAKARMHMDA